MEGLKEVKLEKDEEEENLQEVRERRLLIDKYDSWIIEELKPFLGQRIIEIGCGLGNLLRHLTDREAVIGIEPSSEIVMEMKQKFANHENISVHNYSITDPSVLSLKEMDFDTAVSLNVFEHIDDDQLAMQHTALLLKPGGYFVLIVPAHPWLYGTMDRSIGHYRRYTKVLAKEKLERAGLRVVHQKFLNSLGAIGWFVNGHLLQYKVPPSGQLRILNKFIPFLKAAEQAYSPPFGISLMTIAQKNGDAS
jgi:SAM-dependent methyltransferase